MAGRLAFWLLVILTASQELVAAEAPVSFRNDVMPILARAGCNMGACHGNLNGKGGLKLTLRGQEPQVDYDTLTRGLLGRRTDPQNPEQSLILQKATGAVPHEGGIRFNTMSSEYALIYRWIAAGCRNDSADLPKPIKLIVEPRDQVILEPLDRVQLSAKATFNDGTTRDVLSLAAFETNNIGVANVRNSGEVIREQFGEVVVIVRYLHLQVPVRIAFVPNRAKPDFSAIPQTHPIDKHVLARLEQLRVMPSELSSDSVFIRRAYLDACGITPSVEDVRAFLADASETKREKLIDRLIAKPEFAAFWAQKWADLLRNEEKSLDKKGVQVFHRWIKGWIADDKPLTDFAREIVTGRGSTYANPAANFYRAVRDPYLRAESVAQVFLGLRVSCARCHNHPFDIWTQDDYHRFSGVFARIDYRILENTRRDMLDKHEFVGEQIVMSKTEGELPHPSGGKALPKLLGASAIPANQDRLGVLADWIAAKENPFFAPAQANRIWMHLVGRGLVDPNDDFRSTNPASNPELLNHLAKQFADTGYRIKPLVKHIMLSRTYQLTSTANATNASEDPHFSRSLVQPLEAEQLLDAISQALGVPVKFPTYPLGLRAGDLPAVPLNGRRAAVADSMRFLKVFGKPERLLTCECERGEETGALQAFQLITGELLNTMLRDPENRIGKLIADGKSDSEILEELFLAALARSPSDAEKKLLGTMVRMESTARRAAWEDIAWGLVNSKEFQLRR